MNTFFRKIGTLAAAMVLAAVLILVVDSPRNASAGCGADVTLNIWSETDSRETSDLKGGRMNRTSDWSSRSTIHSDNGQDSTSTNTNHVNTDGSGHYRGESDYSDSEGKGCYSEGVPNKSESTREEDTDSEGNRKDHYVDIVEKNGKCIKYVRDREWDSKGKLIKQTDTETEIPCSKYNLQITFNGTLSKPGATVVYGPNTIIVHLEDKGKIYEGKYESVLDGNVSGFCNGSITWPVLIEVTGTKYEEQKELVFSVKTTSREPWTLGTCEGLSGNMKAGAMSVPPHLFRIAEEGGATYSVTEDPITWTYTLVQK
jgi:hypothetical protein